MPDPELANAHQPSLAQRSAFIANNSQTQQTVIVIPYQTAVRRMIASSEVCAITPKELAARQDDTGTAPLRQRLEKLEAKKKKDSEKVTKNSEESTGKRKPKNIEDISGVNNTEEKIVTLHVPDFEVDFIICDKAHFVKNPRSETHLIVHGLKKEFLLLVTATPLLNSVRDMLGYLGIIWRPEWPFGYTDLDPIPAEEFYLEDTWNAIKEGKEDALVTLSRVTTHNSEKATDLSKFSANELRRRAAFVQLIIDKKHPAWILNPGLYYAYGKTTDWTVSLSLQALKPIMKMISIRRTMTTPLSLPGGETVTPGGDIPPLSIFTVKVKPLAANVRVVNTHTTALMANMYMLAPGQSQVGTKGLVQQSGGAMLNTGKLRTAQVTSFHPDLYWMTQPNARTAKLLKDPAAARQLQQRGKSVDFTAQLALTQNAEQLPPVEGDREIIGLDGTALGIDAENLAEDLEIPTEKIKAKTKGAAPTAGGVAEVNDYFTKDHTYGLRWLHMGFRKSSRETLPESRIAMATYFCHDSPKMAYILGKALEMQAKGERLLIYANYPITCA